MRIFMMMAVACGMVGCGAAPTVDGGTKAAPSAKAEGLGLPVVAIVDGQRVGYEELQPLMLEAVGGDVLREVVLDKRLRKLLAERELAVTEREMDAEKGLLLARLSPDADQAARLLERLREARGLGPRRFEMMLRRNAMLRKLVEGQVQVNEAMVRQAYDQRYGPQTVCRLILVDTLVEAERVLGRLRGGEDFVTLVGNVSKDASRAQGGLIPAISADDVTYPSAVRDVAGRLEEGQVSEPVALTNGVAILRCERKVAAQSVDLESVRDELEGLVRRRAQTLLMQQLARAELDRADVTAMEAELDRGYKRAVREGVGGE